MKTTWSFLGAAAVLSLLGLSGCTAAESEYVVTPDPGSGDSTGGGGGEGGGAGSETGGAPALKIPVIVVPTEDTSTSLDPTETVSGHGVWAPPSDDTSTETITEPQTATDTVATPNDTSAPGDVTDAGGELPSPDATTETGGVVPDPGDPQNGGLPTSSPFPDTTPAPAAPEDRCPGLPFTVRPGVVVDIYGSLIGMHDDLMTSCADLSPETKSRDVVYQVELTEPSTVHVRLGATQFIGGFAIRRVVCNDERVGDACVSSGGPQSSADLALDAGRYWLVVDSADGEFGNFWLQIEAAVPACGDGVQNVDEGCDPGEGAPADGCFDPGTTAECQLGEPL